MLAAPRGDADTGAGWMGLVSASWPENNLCFCENKDSGSWNSLPQFDAAPGCWD